MAAYSGLSHNNKLIWFFPIRIEVHDTGIGLSEEDFRLALKREIRLHQNIAEGQGLGLSIVKDLAIKNNCEIVRLKRPRGGTSIALILPQD